MITNAKEVIAHAEITDVLERLNIELDRNNKCACPVHGGKKKNFSVKGNIATCFSQCGGRTFDSVELVREIHTCTFPEAIEFLAQISGIQLKYSSGGDRTNEIFEAKKREERSKELFELNLKVNNVYIKERGRKTLIGGRKFSSETLDLFGIGVAAADNVLCSTKQIIDKAGLQELSLIRPSRSGDGFYDHFRSRWMFPVYNTRGNIAGFSGRKFKDDENIQNPKYINSAQSLVYDKSDVLYGLHQGARHIRKAKEVYVVEGNTDVLSLFDNGICNVVAPCGTALTDQQAMLLKRYCSVAIMLYDGDDAGRKAVVRNIEPLLEVGFSVKLVLLPDGEDPDSFVRKGVEECKNYLNKEKQDALIYIAKQDYDKDDIFKKDQSIQQAAHLINLVRSEIQRSEYLNAMVKIFGTGTRASLKKQVKERQEKRLKGKRDLTIQQQQDIAKYGVFEKNNRYYETWSTDSPGNPITNFIIKPIMLIVGMAESRRLVEVINQFGRSFIKDVRSDDFVEIGTLKRQIESRGNYIFNGKADAYIKIKSKIYADTPTAYPIFTLGYHKAGFYAWSNGISVRGSFTPVDVYGIVEFDAVKYFLPAFSKISASIKSDDQDNSYEEDKKFIYVTDKVTLNVVQWASEMQAVFGPKGTYGVAYYLASLFRDLIFRRTHYFPHLNLFGPKGSGKSYMGWSLIAMFGLPRAPFHLAQGTNVGLARRLAQVRNGIVWLDEYGNDLDYKRVETLKAAYDGSGHEKGVKSTDNRTVRTSVNSACIISGQQQPVKDIALFERCVSINFSERTSSIEETRRARKLKAVEESGGLSQITSDIQQYRDFIDKGFDKRFDVIYSDMKEAVADKDVSDRILSNHCILATIYSLINDKVGLPVCANEFIQDVTKHSIDQSLSIGSEDELSVWWNLVQFLLSDDQIHHDYDLIVEETFMVRVDNPHKKGSELLDFKQQKRLIYLRFTKIHPKYMEAHRRQFMKGGLRQGGLKHYLKGDKAYIGFTRSKKFAGTSYSAWIFDADKIGLEIPLTVDQMGGDLPVVDEFSRDNTKTTSTASTASTEKIPF